MNIKGKVLDENNVPLPGVNILIKGTTQGTQSDFDGNFSIQAENGDVLIFSYVGTKTIERIVSEDNTYDVVMESDSSELDEIVVVGYGSVRKSDLTGAVSSVSAEELSSVPAMTAAQALQGRAAELFKNNPKKSDYFNLIYEAHLPRHLMTIDVENGELSKLYRENAWLNHEQFSPTDPNLLMYCHEGPWHKVNRIWTYNLSTGDTTLIHKRTVHREIAGHEFFSPDGKTIWFDLQIPRGETFYLAGKNIETGEETRYQLERDEWSIHYNISPDMKTFAGDGGDKSQVAHAEDGQWIYHFTPNGNDLDSEKLVDMSKHNYDLEPNVHFSPDGKWIIFRANFEGSTQIYAVKIEKHKA
ncbi:MAG: oligogalacturonate lyase family protein [Mesonia sp.]|uniref:oligogalacturonate lyase family protein n=1 Tax=Mesonia sp. TaxID=1960830 RepID=UPI003242B4C2